MRDVVIKVVESPEEFAAIQQIRISVFQDEQGVDSALEFDGKDDICQHLIAYLDEQAVGTARIRYLDDQTAKVERLAVLSNARGYGIGKRIMEKALLVIASQNISEVVVHAQEYIKGLYEKLDFIAVGEIFAEAGIPHVEMRKKL
ncbi:GNAT family N-acetyltransferase [Nostoc sp. CENA67]|uniref:GNAT family N-acetyltransferase n=1 Tax=Amazonocrinis nigriterrae CENA67 TaxID=2794033 RepID=A0A8J7LB83_9NOST|nr:GNAT family N-acetyltransferase [Amazonocrinis nigriterrae]MBH8563406.1 GNAT family N-acetyltransferase [Amazonocrinis nigriterrae CENA67]